MAFAPSTPIELLSRLRVVNGALKNPTREKMSEATDALVLGFWASDGGADWINRKRSARSILPGGAQPQ